MSGRQGGQRMVRALGCALALSLLAAPAAGQAESAISHSPATIVFPTPTTFDFDAGAVDHGGVTVDIDVRANQRWRLSVRSVDGNLGAYGKPLSDLLVRAEGSSEWIPVTTADQQLIEGNGDAAVVIYFRLRLSWALDEPDTYGARIIFSI